MTTCTRMTDQHPSMREWARSIHELCLVCYGLLIVTGTAAIASLVEVILHRRR